MSESVIIQHTEQVVEIVEEYDSGVEVVQEVMGELGVVEHIVEGPIGPEGPEGPQGPPGDQYPHDQPLAAAVWVIPHGLGYWPLVQAWDRDGNRIRPGVENVDNFLTKLHFKFAQAGAALLK